MNFIAEGAKIYDADIRNSEIGGNSVVADGVLMIDSVLEPKGEIGRRCFVKHSKIGRGSYIGMHSSVEYADVGKYCSISWGVSIVGGVCITTTTCPHIPLIG